jgi:hypothetical protein
MQIGRLTRPLALSLLAVLTMSGSETQGQVQSHDGHAGRATAQHRRPTREQNALVTAVREATARFKNVTSVEGPGEGYNLMFGCVSGGEFGAMGLHYVNLSLVDGDIDVTQPEIILFEPTANGKIRITGADFLMGQLFHLFDSPNRFGLPAFYTLHVWAWKDNPTGTFTNWNPDVSCDAFNQPQ